MFGCRYKIFTSDENRPSVLGGQARYPRLGGS